jgi:8-oxo-dGTP pyrophosphatase MutT (NUDIX family)
MQENNDSSENNENVRNSITAVIYDNMHKPYFLILKRQKGWQGWEFVKGHINDNETEENAVKREIIEETGLQQVKSIKKLDGFEKKYTTNENTLNVHAVYLIEANMNIPINIPKGEIAEHSTYLWGDFDSCITKLTHENDKDILRKINEDLK